MDSVTFMARLNSLGLHEFSVRTAGLRRTLVLERDDGKKFLIDHPDDYTPSQRLPLLNRFLEHNGF